MANGYRRRRQRVVQAKYNRMGLGVIRNVCALLSDDDTMHASFKEMNRSVSFETDFLDSIPTSKVSHLASATVTQIVHVALIWSTYITSFNVSITSGLLISSSIALGMWTSRPEMIAVELANGDHTLTSFVLMIEIDS